MSRHESAQRSCRTNLIYVVFATLLGLVFAACGGGEKRLCDEIMAEANAGRLEYCADSPDCCFCDCLNAGMEMEFGSTYEDCVCIPGPNEKLDAEECEAVVETLFICADDPPVCRLNGIAVAERECEASSSE